MGSAGWLAHEIAQVAYGNRDWMAWNLLLAVVPAVLAVAVFRHEGRRGPGWWLGAATTLAFLPNAPYVVTDLIHLRSDVLAAPTDSVVVVGVIPLYAAFVTAGFCAYALAVSEFDHLLIRRGRSARTRLVAEAGIHLLSAVGVLLGRVARLNSWDPVVEPTGTISRALATLTWWGAPVTVAALAVTCWLGSAAVRALARAVGGWGTDLHLRLAG